MMEFKEFAEIKHLIKVTALVTQKLHGTNASVWIYEIDLTQTKLDKIWPIEITDSLKAFVTTDGKYLVRPAKRTSFISIEKDNFNFAQWVSTSKDDLARVLGAGTHFGEWIGPGINSGEGIKEKRFVLFDVMRFETQKEEMTKVNLWPSRLDLVPKLALETTGDLRSLADRIMAELKEKGSVYAPGFMRPEGIVINVLGGQTLKFVFDTEETNWRKGSGQKLEPGAPLPDMTHLLQKLRLEKLLSRDEEYVRELPSSLPRIASAYVADLEKEECLSKDLDIRDIEKKSLGRHLFGFIKSDLKERGLLV